MVSSQPQYGLRLHYSRSTVASLGLVEANAKSSRKFFRLGTWIQEYGRLRILVASPKRSITAAYLMNVYRSLSILLYLLLDNIQWLYQVRLIRMGPSKYNRLVSLTWLCYASALIANITQHLRSILNFYLYPSGCYCTANGSAVACRLGKDLADLLIALRGLRLISLHDGYIGVAGITAAFLGIAGDLQWY